jgi:hypothetical protein
MANGWMDGWMDGWMEEEELSRREICRYRRIGICCGINPTCGSDMHARARQFEHLFTLARPAVSFTGARIRTNGPVAVTNSQPVREPRARVSRSKGCAPFPFIRVGARSIHLGIEDLDCLLCPLPENHRVILCVKNRLQRDARTFIGF